MSTLHLTTLTLAKNSILNDHYNFFFKSIYSLKKESGGQRWNEICEDAASLFEDLYVKQVTPLHLDHQPS